MSALAAVLESTSRSTGVVVANGFLSREAYFTSHRPGTFYMLGSMGLGPSIALGMALARPERLVIAIEGDGNFLMGMSAVPLVAATRPGNLLQVVLDDGAYSSTGGQPTVARDGLIARVAGACGYVWVRSCSSARSIHMSLKQWNDAPQCGLLHVRVAARPATEAPRVPLPPEHIAKGVADWWRAEPG
jgi:thiamine pyrophosphate-dependent acetolactate synthase large subunit-like protein